MDVPTLIVPGDDDSHALSAAHFLHECIPGSEYWDVAVEEQSAENAPERILEFVTQQATA